MKSPVHLPDEMDIVYVLPGNPDAEETVDQTQTGSKDSDSHSENEPHVMNSNHTNDDSGKSNGAYECPDHMEISQF